MGSKHGLAEPTSDWIAALLARARSEVTGADAAEDRLRVAGHTVSVRYADGALAELLGRATRHLRSTAGGPPALTIHCWSAPGPALTPPADWPETGTVHADDGLRVVTWDAADGTLRGYDRETRQAWTRFDSLTNASLWEPAAPFRRILHWWAVDNGLQWVHAAAVGRRTGGVLLVGRGGSGKSTTSLACLEAGLDFAGEDGCMIEPGAIPWVHGLYVSAKGDARTAELLPTFTDEFQRSTLTIEGESIIFVDDVAPDGICSGFPLRGIVVPRLEAGSVTRLSPITPAAALQALAPSTLMQLPGSRAGGLQRLAAIVQGLPAWELTLGSTPAAGAKLIASLIDGFA